MEQEKRRLAEEERLEEEKKRREFAALSDSEKVSFVSCCRLCIVVKRLKLVILSEYVIMSDIVDVIR